MTDKTINDEAQTYHAERIIHYLEQGDTFEVAQEKADVDLVEWSQPLPMPEVDFEALWT